MKRSLLLVLLGALLGAFAFYAPMALAQTRPDILEIVSLNGDVDDGMAGFVSKTVDEINDNPRVKGVVLIVNTPGGYVTSSGAIYEDLSRLKVPVVGWCESLCASGGMYLLMAPSVKHIGVRSQTIAGSIGVRAQYWRYYRLLEFLKLEVETYTSGTRKDEGNGTRPATEGEKAHIQARIDSLAATFYGIVGKARGDKLKDWPAVKTADIFIGEEAVKVGLVDAVMTKAEVVAKAKALSGSKLIFTRDELKKMSNAADSGHGGGLYSYEPPAPALQAWGVPDFAYLIDTLKDIRRGHVVRLEYRMP